jgi:hypothetical protein
MSSVKRAFSSGVSAPLKQLVIEVISTVTYWTDRYGVEFVNLHRIPRLSTAIPRFSGTPDKKMGRGGYEVPPGSAKQMSQQKNEAWIGGWVGQRSRDQRTLDHHGEVIQWKQSVYKEHFANSLGTWDKCCISGHLHMLM